MSRWAWTAIAAVSLASAAVTSQERIDESKTTLVYIGSVTRSTVGASSADFKPGQGIYVFRLQSAGTEVFQNVTLVPLGLAAETANPSFFEIDEPRRVLFTVNEIDELDGKPTGAISAFAIGAAGKLTLINQQPSVGTRPCALAREATGRFVLVSHCGTGNVSVFPVGTDGRLGDPAYTGLPSGTPTPCIAIAPESRYVYTCEPATNRVIAQRFDPERGALTSPTPVAGLDAKATPRHIAFRPDGKFAYVLSEQPSAITVFAHEAMSGTWTRVETVSTVPEYYDGPNVGGELQVHRTGRWLYASNVGHNSVVLFTVDPEKGTLTFVEEQGTGGRHPQHFGIEPSSKHLAISNRDSNTVLASRIDEGNGRLKPSGIFADVPSPASIRFLPPMQTKR